MIDSLSSDFKNDSLYYPPLPDIEGMKKESSKYHLTLKNYNSLPESITCSICSINKLKKCFGMIELVKKKRCSDCVKKLFLNEGTSSNVSETIIISENINEFVKSTDKKKRKESFSTTASASSSFLNSSFSSETSYQVNIMCKLCIVNPVEKEDKCIKCYKFTTGSIKSPVNIKKSTSNYSSPTKNINSSIKDSPTLVVSHYDNITAVDLVNETKKKKKKRNNKSKSNNINANKSKTNSLNSLNSNTISKVMSPSSVNSGQTNK